MDRFEEVIAAGKNTFEAVAAAVASIHERKLYLRDYDTWEAYCQTKWGWTRRRGYQLIKAAETISHLKSLADNKTLCTVVHTERAARELNKVEPERRAEVAASVVSSGKPVTAKAINAAAKVVSAPDVVRDEEGHKIPNGVIPLWFRGDEVAPWLRKVSEIKCFMEAVSKADDPLWRDCDLSGIVNHLQNAYMNMATAKPHSICSVCFGHPELQPGSQCRRCLGRGFLSKHKWSAVDSRTKAMMAGKTA